MELIAHIHIAAFYCQNILRIEREIAKWNKKGNSKVEDVDWHSMRILFEFFENLENFLNFLRFMCDWENSSKAIKRRHRQAEVSTY